MREGSAIELEDASVQLAGRTVWSEVSISMARGEFVALLGANGSGKSTLLRVALGALALHRGRVRVLGEQAGARNAAIGYLPQLRSFERGTRLRGVDIVRLGLDGDRWGLPLPLPGRVSSTVSRRCWAATGVAASAATVINKAGNNRFFIECLLSNPDVEAATFGRVRRRFAGG